MALGAQVNDGRLTEHQLMALTGSSGPGQWFQKGYYGIGVNLGQPGYLIRGQADDGRPTEHLFPCPGPAWMKF